MKKLSLLMVPVLFFFSANAYRIEWGRKVVISQPVQEDLYVAGGEVTINAPVYGDLIVAGGTIFLNDTVANDLLLAGGTVHINGYVADDIRCTGGELHVLKNVGGDLVISGGQVDIAPSVQVTGGLITGGGDIVVNGIVLGDVRSAAGTLTFNGTANRNFDCRSQKLVMNGTVRGNAVLAASELTITAGARFYKPVRYWTKNGRVDFKQSLLGGAATFEPALEMKTDSWFYLGHATVLGLVWYLSTVLLFLMLIEYLFRNTFKKAADILNRSMGKSLGFGLLFFVCVPILTVLLLFTIVGIPIGLLLMATYVVLFLLATVITSLVVANWYSIRFERRWGYWQTVWGAMAMFILFKLVTFTPFFGWLIMLALASIAFGAILRNLHWKPQHPLTVQ